MSNQDLELEIKKIFRQSPLPSQHSASFRAIEIIKRCRHELTIRDLINLTGHLTMVMMTLLSGIAKALFKPAEKTAKRTS